MVLIENFLILLISSLVLVSNFDPCIAQFSWFNSEDYSEEASPWSMDDYSNEQPSSYQEYCDNIQKCDTRASLICREGVCDCFKPQGMHYDLHRHKCISEPGEPCKFKIGMSRSTATTIKVTCVENSVCNTRGICTCNTNYFENSQGGCSTVKVFGENCNSSQECSQTLHLHCVQSKSGSTTMSSCSCQPGQAEWSSEYASCVGLAGQPCIDYHCTDKAVCGRSGSQRICRCTQNHFETEQGQCQQKVDMFGHCDHNDECDDKEGQLTCVNGTCTCNPQVSKLHSNGHCVGLLDSPCVNDQCVATAICNDQKKCQCAKGFVKSNLTGECVKDFGSSCKMSDDRSSSISTSSCMDGLVCREEICDCRYRDEIFDVGRQKCLSRVDGDCLDNSNCVGNADCILPKGQMFQPDLLKGYCSCKKNYVENDEGKCDLGFGQKCSRKGECAKLAKLSCIDGSCQCDQMNSKFSEDQGKCVGLVGVNCKIQGGVGECVENTECREREVGSRKLKLKCQCLVGFEQVNGTCVQQPEVYVTV